MWADGRERGGVVLLVDDAPESLRPLVETLEASAVTALVARDAPSAMALLDRVRPDAILLDAVMPVVDGFELCRSLKARAELSSTPVIFMTGLSATENVVEGLRAGGVDYLVKPINPDELVARLSVHIANARIIASSEAALEASGAAIVAFRRDGTISWASPRAQSMSGAMADAATAVAAWVSTMSDRAASDSQPLHREIGDGCVLTVTLIGRTGSGELLARASQTDNTPAPNRLSVKLGLSPREAEVLAWVSQGKTNRDIAEILSLSPRTVNKHLEQVLSKLGVENRTAAAAIAIRALE